MTGPRDGVEPALVLLPNTAPVVDLIFARIALNDDLAPEGGQLQHVEF
jgi:hypothetical protein